MRRSLLSFLFLLSTISACAQIPSGAYVTLTGQLSSSNGLAAKNYALSFKPTQTAFVAGTGIVLPSPAYCATSIDGGVVGVQNPLSAPGATAQFSGSLSAGTYYVVMAWLDGAGNVTLVSPEVTVSLSSAGGILVTPPSPFTGAVGMRVYIGTSSGSETLQGSTGSVGASFTQSSALAAGSALPASNTTVCHQVANDAMWPVVAYTVAATAPNGNSIPGFPMTWQLLGPGTTINLGNGLPTFHGVVMYPAGVLQQPPNHGAQSISGPLGMNGYNIYSVGRLGVGTATPGYGVDVQDLINSRDGYVYNGGTGVSPGQCLVATGSAPFKFVPASCYTPAAVFYQTVASNGAAIGQRAVLNFTPRFTVTDSTNTDVDLAPSGVTAGSCAYPIAVSVDAYGRVTNTVCGTAPVVPTCNSNGCYIQDGHGNINAYGSSTAVGSNTTATNLTITFPVTFTTTTNLTLVPQAVADAAGDGNPHPAGCHVVRSSLSTSGATVVISVSTQVSGSGYSNLVAGDYCSWVAYGH